MDADRRSPGIEAAAPPHLGWWATGLVDGEGCFYAQIKHRSIASNARPGKPRYPSVEFGCEFSVLMRADDRAALQQLRDFLGVGKVRVRRTTYPTGKSGSRPNILADFKVNRTLDLVNVVIPHFERFPLQTKKARDFVVWKEIVLLAASLRGKPGWWKVDPSKKDSAFSLVASLREGRKFDPRLAEVAA